MMNVSTIVMFWNDFLWIESREKMDTGQKAAPTWDTKHFDSLIFMIQDHKSTNYQMPSLFINTFRELP